MLGVVDLLSDFLTFPVYTCKGGSEDLWLLH